MKKGPLAEIKAEFKGDRADLIPVLQRINQFMTTFQGSHPECRALAQDFENEIYGVRPSMLNSGSCLAGSTISGFVWGLLAM